MNKHLAKKLITPIHKLDSMDRWRLESARDDKGKTPKIEDYNHAVKTHKYVGVEIG